ncbi:hypothetical protein PUN28_017496 [Cardiocondyla obscurior]|uniref:Uncharacterized protein n=1 Tax=Cardiocondyla obscurior TaxID=286306 RepID=A0AAW2EJ28_9HYME
MSNVCILNSQLILIVSIISFSNKIFIFSSLTKNIFLENIGNGVHKLPVSSQLVSILPQCRLLSRCSNSRRNLKFKSSRQPREQPVTCDAMIYLYIYIHIQELVYNSFFFFFFSFFFFFFFSFTSIRLRSE